MIAMGKMSYEAPLLSQEAYLGMATWSAYPGDVIFVLKGHCVPYVVRPLDQGRYYLVGECYCDGIIDGEFLDRGRQLERVTLI